MHIVRLSIGRTDLSYHGGGFVLGDIDREDGIYLNSQKALTMGSSLQSHLFQDKLNCSECGISSCS